MKSITIGTVYVLESSRSIETIERDLAQIAKTGIKIVTFWPASNPWLAADPLSFIFDTTLKALDICATLNLTAIIQLIGQNHSQEYMPDTLVSPDMLALDENGVCLNSFWVNHNHPNVDKAVKAYIQKCVTALKDHPAVHAWDVFNEAHHRSDDQWTTALYHTWLKEKYTTIDNLNKKWHRRYADFTEVNPRDRRVSYSVWSSLLPATDYEQFRADNLTDICKRWANYVRDWDTSHPVIIDGTAGQILSNNVVMRNCDEFGVAHAPDIFGGTFYPKSWGRNLSGDHAQLSLYYEISAAAARNAGKSFIVSELQTHTQSALTPGSEVSGDELAAWTWTALASGAQEMHYWRWRPFLHGYQSTGRGLRKINGDANARSKAIAKLCSAVTSNEMDFASAMPAKPDIKILISYRNRMIHDAFMKWTLPHYATSIKAWHRLLWRWCTAIQIDNLQDPLSLDSTAVVLPAAISVSESEAQKLKEYVENGGILIADGRLGTVNEFGEVPEEGIPGNILSGLFGFIEDDVDEGSCFSLGESKIAASFMTQHVTPLDSAQVVAHLENGQPAIIENHVGRGKTVYITSFVGLCDPADTQGEITIADYIRSTILSKAPQTIWASKDDALHVALTESESGKYAFISSMSNERQCLALHNLPLGKPVCDCIAGSDLELTDGTLEIELQPWEYKALKL